MTETIGVKIDTFYGLKHEVTRAAVVKPGYESVNEKNHESKNVHVDKTNTIKAAINNLIGEERVEIKVEKNRITVSDKGAVKIAVVGENILLDGNVRVMGDLKVSGKIHDK